MRKPHQQRVSISSRLARARAINRAGSTYYGAALLFDTKGARAVTAGRYHPEVRLALGHLPKSFHPSRRAGIIPHEGIAFDRAMADSQRVSQLVDEALSGGVERNRRGLLHGAVALVVNDRGAHYQIAGAVPLFDEPGVVKQLA